MPVDAFPGMKFGADPELFVVDQDGKGVCPLFLEGTKENPEPVKGGALQRDGMAAEFNIDPATSYKEWENNFQLVLKELESRLPKGHTLKATPSFTFTEDVWDNVPDDAKQLGCSPDFNAWTMSINPPPDGEAIPRMRTAAGHIHAGWDDNLDLTDPDYISSATDLVKQLDWFLGAPSVSLDHDTVRRKLYGKAGAMRFKPYGVEYRVLSNFWVTSKHLRLWTWNRLQTAIHQMAKNFHPEKVENPVLAQYKFNDKVVQSINDGVTNRDLSLNYPYPIREI